MDWAEFMRFADDSIERRPGSRCGAAELLAAARLWCDLQGIAPPNSMELAKYLLRAGHKKKQSNNIYYLDISLKAPAQSASVNTSGAAKLARRALRLALEDHYCDLNRVYKNGKSDGALAKEFGLSEAFVRQVREQDYGPLEKPQGLDDFGDKLADLRSRIDIAVRDLKNLAHAYESLCREYGWTSEAGQ